MATTLTRFYSYARRKASREQDFGLYWRDGQNGPTYRAAWLEATGELIAVRHGALNDGGGMVERLGVFPDVRDVQDALDGWEEICGEPDSIHWLRARSTLWPFATAV